MAGNDEIKTRVSVEDHASDPLKKVSREERNLAGETRKAGDTAEKASKQHTGLGGAMGRLGGSVRGMVASWGSFIAISGAIVAAFADIANASKKALDNVVQMGEALRGMASAIGGKRADKLNPRILDIAEEETLDKAGGIQLIQAATQVARAEPGLTDEQILQRTSTLAQFQRLTGVGGEEGFRTLQAIRTTRGGTFEEAGDTAAALFGARMDTGMIQDLVQEGASVGMTGERTLPLLLAARGRKLLSENMIENLNTFAEQLVATDETGNLTEGLRGLGLRQEMDFVAKLATLRSGLESGRITRGQVAAETGAAEMTTVFDPLAASLSDLPAAERYLSGFRIEDAIGRQRESKYVRAAERQRSREMGVYRASLESGLDAGAELQAEGMAYLKEQGGGSVFAGAMDVATMYSPPRLIGEYIGDKIFGEEDLPGGGSGGVTINNTTNIGNQYNRQDPTTAPPGNGRSNR